MQPAAVLSAGVASVVFPPNLPLPDSIWLHMEGIGAALLLLYCCFTAALLLLILLYGCSHTGAAEMRLNSDARVGKTAALLLLYCCFTAAYS